MRKVDPELLKMYLMGGASPSAKIKVSGQPKNVVDLHRKPNKNSCPSETFISQLQQFEKEIDSAIVSGKEQFRILHGNGSGVLKRKIHDLLKSNSSVKSFHNDYHPEYGWGSTLVIFK